MIDNILPLYRLALLGILPSERLLLVRIGFLSSLKFCSMFLVISLVNGGRYLFLKRKLQRVYVEHKEEILKAIKGNKVKFSSFLVEPTETGDDMLDLLLFKIHRSALWFMGLLIFYPVAVFFLYISVTIIKHV